MGIRDASTQTQSQKDMKQQQNKTKQHTTKQHQKVSAHSFQKCTARPCKGCLTASRHCPPPPCHLTPTSRNCHGWRGCVGASHVHQATTCAHRKRNCLVGGESRRKTTTAGCSTLDAATPPHPQRQSLNFKPSSPTYTHRHTHPHVALACRRHCLGSIFRPGREAGQVGTGGVGIPLDQGLNSEWISGKPW